jgi:hypothetical protein
MQMFALDVIESNVPDGLEQIEIELSADDIQRLKDVSGLVGSQGLVASTVDVIINVLNLFLVIYRFCIKEDK